MLIAKFNYAWQLGYETEEPIRVRKGTRMIVTAHHDNSANNPYNPNPNEEVRWGGLTSEEMVLPWFGVVVDLGSKPDRIASYRPGSAQVSRGFFPAPGATGGRTPPFLPNIR